MTLDNGILTISLDFELYWGVRDKKTIRQYENNLQGVKNTVSKMLVLFQEYSIHATWATTGFLFFSDAHNLMKNLPGKLPNYINTNLSPYLYINESGSIEPRYHFAPELINLICKYDRQEIGTHTFSHYYCLEKGQDLDSFYMDMASAIKVAQARGIKIKSLVFPRNQFNQEYISILPKMGIKNYRGNESGWLYRAANYEVLNKNKLKRALRLLDAYINISGHNTYNIRDLSQQKPFSIPSSRFLRPFSKKLVMLEKLRLKRITNAMDYAAKNKRIFHLWWHPHNFGINTAQNIDFLIKILDHYQSLEKKYGMTSLNMGETSDLIEAIK